MIPLPVTPGRATELPAAGTVTAPTDWPPFKHVELEINTACDLDCFGCDRFSDVIHEPNMTLQQVNLFIKESLELNWGWERIRLLGGEPTLHPHFLQIVGAVLDYRRVYPKCFIQVLSNGLGKLNHYMDWLLYRGVDPHVESKAKGEVPHWFNNTRMAPVDRDPNVGELPPCGIFGERGCGIGLSRYGFYLDGAGAAVARVAGFDVGIQSLKDVTWDAMLEQARILCRVCGHWNPDAGALVTQKVSDTGRITGPYWTERLAAYKRQPPKMTLYGSV